MSTLGPLLTAIGLVLGIVAAIGTGLVYLRSNYVKERDQVRSDTIEGLRELAATQEMICDAEKAERDTWIERLQHHHDAAHPRCRSGPERDA